MPNGRLHILQIMLDKIKILIKTLPKLNMNMNFTKQFIMFNLILRQVKAIV